MNKNLLMKSQDTSTDSSDDESEAQKLKEAVVDAQDIFGCKEQNNKTVENPQPRSKAQKSKRDLQDDSKAETDALSVAPEVRNFLAKKLSDIVESQIEVTKTLYKIKNDETSEESEEHNGVKLFSNSSACLVSNSTNLCDKQKSKSAIKSAKSSKPRKKCPSASSSDSEMDAEQLAAIAVSGEFILSAAKLSAEQSKSQFEKEITSSKNAETCHSIGGSSVKTKSVSNTSEHSPALNNDSCGRKDKKTDIITNDLEFGDVESKSSSKKRKKKKKQKVSDSS